MINNIKKSIKIALINPRVESYSGTLPALGLLYIAALLEKYNFSVRIFDLYPYDDRDIPDLLSYQPDIIGMTVLTDYWLRAKHIAHIIKNKLPNSTFIIGGVHVTTLSKESLVGLGADIGIIGEGEYTMLELCDHLNNNFDWKNILGIAYINKNGDFIHNVARPYIENLDELPHPARHLLDFEKYLVPPGMIRGYWFERSTTVMTSRGCPFSCIWCGSQCTFGRKVRYRSADNITGELQYLINNYSVNAVWFVDDTFTLDKKRVLEFCENLLSNKIKLAWGCQAHVKTADEKMFRAMRIAGCVQLDFGVESGSNRVLKSLKKNSDSDSIKRAFSIAKKVGLRTCATFMFGSPSETEEDIKATFQLAKEINPDFTSSYFITPYPGTELMEMVEINDWKMATDRSDKGSKKGPILTIYFTEKDLMHIRAQFQKLFAFRNFSGLFTRPYFVKAVGLLLRYPGGIISGFKAFLKTFVFDDFVFAFLVYYTKNKSKSIDKKIRF